jgi:hypothetical protein
MLAPQSGRQAQCEIEQANLRPRVCDLLKIIKLSVIFKGYQFWGI